MHYYINSVSIVCIGTTRLLVVYYNNIIEVNSLEITYNGLMALIGIIIDWNNFSFQFFFLFFFYCYARAYGGI